MLLLRRLVTTLLMLALATCGGGGEEPKKLVVEAGPEGKVIEFEGLVLSIPAGALAGSVKLTISMSEEGSIELTGRKRISPVYLVSPPELSLASPVTILITWDEARVPLGIDTAEIDLRQPNEAGEAARLRAVQLEAPTRLVWGESQRLGRFWATSPLPAQVATLRLSPASARLKVGEELQLKTSALDADGGAVTGMLIDWASADPLIAGVDAMGMVKALRPGPVRIRAAIGEVVGEARLLVENGEPFARNFAWKNPLPQGNGLSAVGGDAGATYLADAAGGIWARPAQGGSFSLFHSELGARFAALSTGPLGLIAAGSREEAGLLLWFTPDGVVRHELDRSIEDTQLLYVWQREGEALAVGTGPRMARFDGAQWSDEWSPLAEPLLAAFALEGEVAVIGARGTVYRRDGAGWGSWHDGGLPDYLIAARIVDEVPYAISERALYRFVAGAWEAIELSSELRPDVLGSAGSLLLVVAYDSYDGRYLLSVQEGQVIDAQAVGYSFVALWGANPSSYTAVTADGSIVDWETTHFAPASSGLTGPIVGLVATEDGALFAAANRCADMGCTQRQGRLLSKVGERFQPLGEELSEEVHLLAGSDPFDLIAATTQDKVYRWNGTTWGAPLSVPKVGSGTFSAAAVCAGGTWLARGSHIYYQPSGGEWRDLYSDFSSRRIRALACSGEALFAAGDHLLMKLWGDGAFREIDPETDRIYNRGWRAIWADADGRVVVGGDARYVIYWDGAKVVAFDQPAGAAVESIRAIAGRSIGDLWAVGTTLGGAGFAAHFDGANWESIDPLTQGTLDAVAVRDGAVWVGGSGGAILGAVP